MVGRQIRSHRSGSRPERRVIAAADLPSQLEIPSTDDAVKLFNACISLSEIASAYNISSLSAPLIGIPWRLFTIRENDKWEYYVDCSYEPASDQMVPCIEKSPCLIEGANFRHFEVRRYRDILWRGNKVAFDSSLLETQWSVFDACKGPSNLVTICAIQHEIDVCDGKLIDEVGEELQLW